MEKNFEIHYHVNNQGDGSVAVRLHQTKEEAEKADEKQSEGWGESSADSIRIKMKDGKLYFQGQLEEVGKGKWEYAWHEIKKVK